MAYILYHADCYDGFGAAWAINKGLLEQCRKHDVVDTFLPVFYGQPMPAIPDGQQVILADFCYPKDEMQALAERSYFVSVFDHHKTAQKDIESLQPLPPNMEIVFDMNRSAAVICWEEFCNGRVPRFLMYIQDRDLWTRKLPEHEETVAYIQSFPRTFENYDYLERILNETGIGSIYQEGKAILRYKAQKVEEMAKHTRLQSVGGYANIPVVNAPYNFSSDVCHLLLQQYPDSPFSAYYFDRGDGVQQWGLRSREGFDCSVVAKQFGGGGHAQAAGFELRPEG